MQNIIARLVKRAIFLHEKGISSWEIPFFL